MRFPSTLLERRRYFFILGGLTSICLGLLSGYLLLQPPTRNARKKNDELKQQFNRQSLQKFCKDIPKGKT